MTHQCPGPGCDAEVDSSMLMCPRCWRLVPAAVRRAVWIAWRRGAGAGTPAHRAAIRLAIAAVNRDVVPASSLNHPACGVTFHGSTAGRASSPQRPGGHR